MAIVDETEGLSEMNVNKRNPEYVKERQTGPRFAMMGSFEYEWVLFGIVILTVRNSI